nr:hypothetical protein [Candidatus Gracilibacteria bacterium]
MKKIINVIIMVILPFILSSCNWDGIFSFAGDFMCTYAPDSDHCTQFIAVQSGSPSKCESIKGTKFKDTGSNPPKDKCYMQVAINKGDYNICKNIKGGPMSYTEDECIKSVGKNILDLSIKNDDLNGCKKLEKFPSGYQDSYDECRSTLASVEKMKSRDTKMDELINALKDNPKDKDLQKQLENLKNIKQSTYEMMTPADKGNYFKEKREEIMGDVEDEDVKSAIAKEYTAYKGNETNINNMLDKLQEVTEKQKTLKRLDDEANELTDKLKEQLEGLVNDKQDEIIGEMGDKAKEWIDKNGGENLKWSLKNYEWAMEKYEKGSKMYEDAKGKYDKLKKVYDEVMGVYQRVDEVNKLLAQGKIDEGKAKVLKGAVLLDKGLEYATSYVPVFGSTISTISKETFDTVIKLAKKRAERTTAIDKCIEDPEHCDPNNISAY